MKYDYIRKCEFCDKTSENYVVYCSRNYKVTACSRHWQQIKSKGRALERTKFDPNICHVYDDRVEIEIERKNKIYLAIIDKEDYERVKSCKWNLNDTGYVVRKISNGQKRTISYLQWEIMGSKSIDHINGNPLDNRKCNLRIATRSQNAMNRRIPRNNTSGKIGVKRDKRNDVWVAQIGIEGKRLFLGEFKLKEDAIKARKEAEEKYFGEFARKIKD